MTAHSPVIFRLTPTFIFWLPIWVFLSYVFLFVFGKWRDVLNANGLRRIDYGRAGVELHTIL